MHALLRRHHAAIAVLCRRVRVQTLSVVGAAARGVGFNPFRSDVDVLVESIPPRRERLFDRHFGLVVARAALRNPRIRAAMAADAQPLDAVPVPTP